MLASADFLTFKLVKKTRIVSPCYCGDCTNILYAYLYYILNHLPLMPHVILPSFFNVRKYIESFFLKG